MKWVPKLNILSCSLFQCSDEGISLALCKLGGFAEQLKTKLSISIITSCESLHVRDI
jgi:hypothetical protein